MRQSYENKPVVFIAVNSGNPRSDVEGYAKSTKFEWPILVDERRETEKALGTEISLQNIYQWFVIDPEGKVMGVGSDQKQAMTVVDRNLAQAKMLFDGITVPEKLKAAAREIEMGQFDPTIGDLAALAQKGPKGLQEAAQQMYDKLKPLAEGGLERGKALDGEGKKYAAYQEYSRVAAWFKKTDYEKTATAALADLKKQKEVQDELAAKQMLDQAKALLGTGKKSDKPAADGILAALQKKYPNSEAAKEAAKLK